MGNKLRSRTLDRQKDEVRLSGSILNKMTFIGTVILIKLRLEDRLI